MIPKMFCIRLRMVKPEEQGLFDTICFTGETVSSVVEQARIYSNRTQALMPTLQINYELFHTIWSPISFTEEALTDLLADPSTFKEKEKKL